MEGMGLLVSQVKALPECRQGDCEGKAGEERGSVQVEPGGREECGGVGRKQQVGDRYRHEKEKSTVR